MALHIVGRHWLGVCPKPKPRPVARFWSWLQSWKRDPLLVMSAADAIERLVRGNAQGIVSESIPRPRSETPCKTRLNSACGVGR